MQRGKAAGFGFLIFLFFILFSLPAQAVNPPFLKGTKTPPIPELLPEPEGDPPKSLPPVREPSASDPIVSGAAALIALPAL